MEYINTKCATLADLGISNRRKLKNYFISETANISDPTQRENKIDRLARSIIMNYYDGDRTFVGTYDMTGKTYYDTLKAKAPKYKILYENLVIRFVGKKGMRILLDNELISAYTADNGDVAYTIADTFPFEC